jgi:amino acid adenylation domain-containing protein
MKLRSSPEMEDVSNPSHLVAQPEHTEAASDEVFVFPASFAQQRLWFLDKLEPGQSAYNVPFAIRLSGPLDTRVLQQSFQELIGRHEVLRTTLSDNGDGEPLQIVATTKEFLLPVSDLRDLPVASRAEKAQQLILSHSRSPFDLRRGPLVRVNLLQLSDDEHILSLVFHHAVVDGWSWGIVLRELSALYEAFLQGKSSPLPNLPLQYGDYATWQQDRLKGEHLSKLLYYWQRHLEGAPPILELPTDFPRPAVQTYEGEIESTTLGSDLVQRLESLAREEGCTLFMLLLAAYNLLLSRYSRQEDIVVGTPVAGRDRTELEGVVGLFVNSLALRTNLSGDPPFRDLLGRVREATLGAYAHQELPFEKLVGELQSERSLSHSPLFQAMFILQNLPRKAITIPGLTLSPIEISSGSAKLDLILTAVPKQGEIRLALTYNVDLFHGSTIRSMLGHFVTLLEAVVANPAQPLSALDMLSRAERQRLLYEWNQTDHATPAVCIHELFEKQVQRVPGRTALVFEDRQLSYAELNQRANQLAHYLKKLGVGPDVRVGLCVDRSIEMMIGLLGILKAGGAYVPLDPTYPMHRLAFMMQDAAPLVIVTQQSLKKIIPELKSRVVALDEEWRHIEQEDTQNFRSRSKSEDPCYVIYTSGSTGRPKGVQLEHRNVVNFLNSVGRLFSLNEADTFLGVASMSFDASVLDFYLPLSTGARLVLLSREGGMDPQSLAATMRANSVNAMHATPSTWRMLVDTGWPGNPEMQILSGGEALSWDLAKELLPRSASLWNLYGPTETAVYSAIHRVTLKDGSVLVGKPIDNTRIYVLGPQNQPVPAGIPGEIFIGGSGVARGYLNRPELTAERFAADPFRPEPGARMYHTGDLGRLRADGLVECLGRIDNQVKLRGFRIELGEIETALAQHPAVQQAIATVREDTAGDRRLVAYLVCGAEPKPEPEALRKHLQQVLPDYMVPSTFVFLDKLPLSPSGKADRRALPKPEEDASRSREVVAPRTAVEEVLVGIWAQVLHHNNLGVHDNFFELGGHSLLATQVVSRLQRAFGVDIPLRALFEEPTVAGLARRVEQLRRAGEALHAPPLLPVPRTDKLPLSFSQQRLWFLDQLQPGTPAYNIPIALRLSGTLDIGALRKSLNEIVRRHEVLRTRFAVTDDQPFQVIANELTIDLPMVNLSGIADAGREQEARRKAEEESQLSFDLQHGPLIRAKLLHLGKEDHILLLTMHHIVSDGWSMGIFSRELAATYRAFSESEAPQLPELPIQYADFSAWQRSWLQGETLEKQVGYWTAKLADAPQLLKLPTDRPRPSVETFRGATYAKVLPIDLLQQLKAFTSSEGVTLFMTLLAAFNVLLSRHSNQEDILVGSPIANRNRSELEGLIGFFVNTLVLRTDLSGNPSFRELLKRVREVALDAYAHQDLPFDKLVEHLPVERSLSHNPVFQVMFALQNAPSEKLRMPGLSLSGFPVTSIRSMFDLTLFMWESADGLALRLQYNTDLFDSSTISRIIERLEVLLEGILSDPGRPISELPLLTKTERKQLLEEWNDTGSEYSRNESIHHLIESQAQHTPDSVAIEFVNQMLSYAQLNSRANQLAHYLQKCGVSVESRVGLYLERSPEMLVAILGVLKAGAAYVPLDPAYPKDRIAFIVEDSQLQLLLTQQRLVEQLPAHSAPVVRLDADWLSIASEGAANPGIKITPRNLAYVLYTSGSTGKPKGVQIEHGNVVNFLCSMQREPGLSGEDVLLAVTTLSFDIAGLELFLPLTVGARIVLATREQAIDGAQLLGLLEESGVTVLQATPATWRLLLESGWTGKPDLKVLCGGEALPRELAEQLLPRCAELWNMYGPTETTIWSSVFRVEDTNWTMAPIGRPIANTQMYVLDKQRRPLPIGVAGELYIGGDGVARGYWNRPELTAEKFVDDPFSSVSGARLYATGDQVRLLADGNIQYLGRLDSQVKVRGYRIELGEIESVLAQHDAVKQSVVLVREDEPGNQNLVAYLLLDQGHDNPLGTATKTLASEQVSQWGTTWDETYKQTAQASEATFNITGWNSSYTGLPVPKEEMAEWVDRTVERIQKLEPKKLLEVGCGTGLLLFRLAPLCDRYEGTDLSQTALNSIRAQLDREPDRFRSVSLNQRSADDLSAFPARTFDTLVLNSVVQYFPNVDYLVRVLKQAVDLMKDGGSIFIGDVRNLGLLEAFHTAVQLHQADDQMNTRELLQRVRRGIEEERELVIDPTFFLALQQELPRISDVQIQLKSGYYHNEVTQFRYDVILRIGSAISQEADCVWLDWQNERLTPESLGQLLQQNRGELIGISSIPNARNWEAVSAWRKINEKDAPPTAADLRKLISQSGESLVEPDAIARIASDAGYSVTVEWSRESSAPVFDAVFHKLGTPWAKAHVGRTPIKYAPLDSYANNPLRQAILRQMVPDLKLSLKKKLPEYMVPSTFMVLDAFPLTPNGKVDRRALPAPGASRLDIEASYVAPRTDTERALATIWAEVLRIDHIGTNHDFFALGGHSLLATQVISRIHKHFNRDLALQAIFEHPTIAGLANQIDAMKAAEPLSDSPIIAAANRSAFRVKRSSF